MNDDARSPGSGSTPGPLSQQPPSGLDTSDPGELIYYFDVTVCSIKLSVKMKIRPLISSVVQTQTLHDEFEVCAQIQYKACDQS